MKSFSGFVHGIDDDTVIALADHSSINLQRGLSPIELEQNCAAAIDRYFAERFPIKQILANDVKGLLDLGAVELRPIVRLSSLSPQLTLARYFQQALTPRRRSALGRAVFCSTRIF